MWNLNWRTLIVGGSALIVFGWNFWGSPVYWLDEVKNAWCAFEILHSGQPFVPSFNGEYHDKPGLPYYFMQMAYLLFGVNSFSARFFSVLCGVGVVLIIYSLTRRHVNVRSAWIAAFSLIASLQMGMQFKMATPDPYLLFFLTAAFASFFQAFIDRNSRLLLIFYLCIGLAFFAKGPVAVALPGLAIILFLLLGNKLNWSTIRWILNPAGIFIFLVSGCTWYLCSGLATHGDWLEYFFINHNLDRYSNTFEGHRGFPLDTWVILVGGLLPLSVFFPQTALLVWRERNQNSVFLFSFCVIVAFCGFFMFSKTVLPSYPAPAMPFGALLIGSLLSRKQAMNEILTSDRISGVVLVVIALALAVGGYVAVRSETSLRHLATELLPVFAILPVGCLVGLVFLFRRQMIIYIWSVLVSFMAFQVVIFSFFFPVVNSLNPVTQSVAIIKQSHLPVVCFRKMNPAFVFQLGHKIEQVNTPDELARYTNTHGEVIVLSTSQDWNAAQINGFKILFEGKDLFEPPITLVLTNRP